MGEGEPIVVALRNCGIKDAVPGLVEDRAQTGGVVFCWNFQPTTEYDGGPLLDYNNALLLSRDIVNCSNVHCAAYRKDSVRQNIVIK